MENKLIVARSPTEAAIGVAMLSALIFSFVTEMITMKHMNEERKRSAKPLK